MSEHTNTPWVVDQSRHHVCIWDSEGGVRIHYHRGLSSGVEPEHADNARHIVHCVNNMPKVVEALREAVETIEDQYDSLWSVAGYGKKPPCKDSIKARTLLAALEAEKGGEL